MRNSLGMTRKVVAGAAALALLASNVSVLPNAAAATFSDVPMNAWYYDYVMDLVDMGIVSGNPDGTFRPDNSLNRAEMAKIAVNVAKRSGVISSDDMSGAPTFKDVPAGQWFHGYVTLAAKNKIFEGYRDAQGNLTGNFGPGNTVNRAEASKVLLLAAGVPEMLTPGAPFMDVASTDWFYAYVTSAYNWSILDGYKTADGKLTGYFGPGDPVTRAQISKIAVLAQDPIDRYTGEPLNNMNTNGGTTNMNTNSGTGSNMNTNSVPTAKVSFEAAIARDANGNVFPAASTLATGTAFNTVTAINVTAGKDEDVKISEMTMMSRGFVSDSTISGVLVVDGEGKRHGNIVSFSSSKASVNFGNDPIIVKAGTTQQLKVQLNFNSPAGFTSGTVGVEVTDIKAWGASTGGMVKVNFLENKPLMGNIHSLVTGSNIGNVTFDDVTITSAVQDVDLGVKNKEVSKFKLTQANSQEDIMLTELTVFNNGNSGDTDIENIKLVDQNGVVLAEVKNTKNRYAIFDLSAKPYVIPKGTSRNVSVLVDVINGSTRTIQFVVSNDYDVKVKGATSQAFLLPAAGTSDTSFPIGDTANRNTLLVKEGTLTVSKATSSPSGEVSRGSTEVVIGEFKVEAAGEDIEIYGGSINVSTTSTNGAELKGTFKVQNGSGTTLHSVNAVETAFDTMFDATTGNGADVISRFNNPYTVKAGTTGTIRFVVDVADAATAGATLQASLEDLLIKKISSNRTGTAAATTVTANTMTITAANLSVAKNSAFGDQNVVKGATSQRIGSFNLTTTNAEGVSVSSIVLNLNDNSGITNLKLMHNGAQIGSTIATPGTTSNTFGVSGQLSINKASSKTVDVYADVASSSAATTLIATVPQNGVSSTGLQSANTVTAPAAAVAGQTNTVVANGSVTVAFTSSTSAAAVLHSGEAGVSLFTFSVKAANNEDMILQRAKIAVANGQQAVTNLELYDGDTKLGGPLTLTNGVADFSGFQVTVPKNTTKNFTVKGSTVSGSALASDNTFTGGLYYYESRGAASGIQSNVYAAREIFGNTTDNVANTYAVGDVAMFYDNGGNASLLNVGTAGGAATAVSATAGDIISNLPILSTETSSGAGAVTNTYAAGDVLVTGAGAIQMATSATQVNGGAFANSTRYSRLPIASTELVSQAQYRYEVGDVLAIYDASGTSTVLGIVTVAGTAATATVVSTASPLQAADRISKFPAIMSDPMIATLDTSKYAIGDVVAVSIDNAAPTLRILTNVTSTTLTAAPVGGAAAALTIAGSNDSIVKLFSARGEGRQHFIENTEVVPAFTNGARTAAPTADDEIAAISLTAAGEKDAKVNTLTFNVTGSFISATGGTVSNFQLYDGATLIATGTNAQPGVGAGAQCTANTVGYVEDTDTAGANNDCTATTITFTPAGGYTINAGMTKNLTVRANTSSVKSLATTNSVSLSLQLQGTSAARNANNAVSYSYDSERFGTTITTNVADVYPKSSATLTY